MASKKKDVKKAEKPGGEQVEVCEGTCVFCPDDCCLERGHTKKGNRCRCKKHRNNATQRISPANP